MLCIRIVAVTFKMKAQWRHQRLKDKGEAYADDEVITEEEDDTFNDSFTALYSLNS